MDKRQIDIELQSARRDAIELYKLEHNEGKEVDLDKVKSLTIKLYNLQRTLSSKLTG